MVFGRKKVDPDDDRRSLLLSSIQQSLSDIFNFDDSSGSSMGLFLQSSSQSLSNASKEAIDEEFLHKACLKADSSSDFLDLEEDEGEFNDGFFDLVGSFRDLMNKKGSVSQEEHESLKYKADRLASLRRKSMKSSPKPKDEVVGKANSVAKSAVTKMSVKSPKRQSEVKRQRSPKRPVADETNREKSPKRSSTITRGKSPKRCSESGAAASPTRRVSPKRSSETGASASAKRGVSPKRSSETGVSAATKRGVSPKRSSETGVSAAAKRGVSPKRSSETGVPAATKRGVSPKRSSETGATSAVSNQGETSKSPPDPKRGKGPKRSSVIGGSASKEESAPRHSAESKRVKSPKRSSETCATTGAMRDNTQARRGRSPKRSSAVVLSVTPKTEMARRRATEVNIGTSSETAPTRERSSDSKSPVDALRKVRGPKRSETVQATTPNRTRATRGENSPKSPVDVSARAMSPKRRAESSQHEGGPKLGSEQARHAKERELPLEPFDSKAPARTLSSTLPAWPRREPGKWSTSSIGSSGSSKYSLKATKVAMRSGSLSMSPVRERPTHPHPAQPRNTVVRSTSLSMSPVRERSTRHSRHASRSVSPSPIDGEVETIE